MRFKLGQKVVCVKPVIDGEPNPKYGEIVTVERYRPGWPNAIILVEYPYEIGYYDFRFEPLMDISELTEILEQQPEHA